MCPVRSVTYVSGRSSTKYNLDSQHSPTRHQLSNDNRTLQDLKKYTFSRDWAPGLFLVRCILPARFELGLLRLRFVPRQAEPVQVHRRQNRSLKILLHAGDASLLLRFVLRIIMIKNNRLYLRFRGKFSKAIDGEMFLLHVGGKLLFAGRRPVVPCSHLVNEPA